LEKPRGPQQIEIPQDHDHLNSVEEVIGYLEEKSSTWIAQNVERKARNSLGHKLWARKYFVSRTPEIASKLQLKLASP
jgi:hypothetical protein